MINIRYNLFETNSSSVHSMTLLSKDEMDAFDKGELYIDFWGNNLYTKDEANNLIIERCKKYNMTPPSSEEEWDEAFADEGIYDVQRFDNIEYYETFCDRYDKNGQTLYAIGYTGYDS